jgi:hypothetical protein
MQSIRAPNALIICITAAAVSSCSAYRASAAMPAEPSRNGAQTGSQTFKYTGIEQHFIVPSGVTRVTIVGRGGGTPSHYSTSSGPLFTGSNGGLVEATISVKPGEHLAIFVGGKGRLGLLGGAGAPDVREGGDDLHDRVIVAGGGVRGTATGQGGSGGTQSSGGVGGQAGYESGFSPGVPGHAGKLWRGGGGGGGSSYVEHAAVHVKNIQAGGTAGNGKVVIS